MTEENAPEAKRNAESAEQVRHDRVRALAEKYRDAYEPGYLQELREDWDG